MRIVLRKSWSRRGYDIWLFQNHTHVAKPIKLEFEETGDGYLLSEPTLQVSSEQWHMLRDSLKEELVANGFQPKADVLEGELKATKIHLDDMRTLVFKEIKE